MYSSLIYQPSNPQTLSKDTASTIAYSFILVILVFIINFKILHYEDLRKFLLFIVPYLVSEYYLMLLGPSMNDSSKLVPPPLAPAL